MTRVAVELERCEGHGLCEQMAPQIYRVSDDGKVEILVADVTPELLAVATTGARFCPVAALRIVADPVTSHD